LISQLMCDVDDRLGTQGVEVRGAFGRGGGGNEHTHIYTHISNNA
jgi:hypothetical protein